MFGPIYIFNLYLNDLFLCLHNSDLYNFTGDNTITATCKCINDFLHTLEKEAERPGN